MTKRLNTLKMAQSFKLAKLIEANGKIVDGYWEYNDGWSDNRVAQVMGCAVGNAVSRRREIFGDLKSGGARIGTSSVISKIEEHETQLAALRVDQYKIAKRTEALEKVVNILLSSMDRKSIPEEKLQELREKFGGHVTVTPKATA